MATGEVRDFRNPNKVSTTGGVKILTASSPQGVEVVNEQPLRVVVPGEVEVRQHEEIITQDEKLRRAHRKPGDPEVRVRVADHESWRKVREDE